TLTCLRYCPVWSWSTCTTWRRFPCSIPSAGCSRIPSGPLSRQGNSKGRRRAPRLVRELVSVTLFTVATMLAVGVLIGRSSGGVLASSGLIIAILGFAIRNVLADVLSGIALGLEAPFRIGDWVEFDTVTAGRVIEIG